MVLAAVERCTPGAWSVQQMGPERWYGRLRVDCPAPERFERNKTGTLSLHSFTMVLVLQVQAMEEEKDATRTADFAVFDDSLWVGASMLTIQVLWDEFCRECG